MARDNWREVRMLWQGGRAVFGAVAGAVQFGQLINQHRQMNKPRNELMNDIDPMAGLASADDLAQFAFDPDGFYLGHIHEDHGVSFEASIPADDDRHVFIVAGSASGKGLTYGIQNGIRWPGPLLAIDPKGEMAEITGMVRGSRANARGSDTSVREGWKNQKVAILDPMGEVRGPAKKYRIRYDPMSDIDMRSPRIARRRIADLASGMVIPEGGDNAHFSENAETLIAGTIEAVKTLEAAKDHNLPFLRRKILGNVKLKNEDQPTTSEEPAIKAGFEALYDYLTHDALPDDGHAAEAASVLGEVLGSDEAGSFRTTLSRNLKWLIDLDMQDHLTPSSFSLWKAVQEGWSIFLVLNPDDIGKFRNWLRMNVQMALSAKMRMGTNQTGPQTLFFLDEFPVLGRFKEIEEKAGYIRGYGVKLVPIIQNVGQLQALYDKNWETFLGNAAAVIAWGVNDLETEEYLSKRIGKVMVTETSQGESDGISGMSGTVGRSQNTARHERQIRFTNEVREQGARKTMRAFVIPASGRAFTVRRVSYTELERFKTYDSPEHILRVEKGLV
ncbi:type IV secretory system conjugative DNA transfer family protein [Shimia thalassica]|nr:type IV secretory system conjugative DNA transfer family protein [Shimia thalassica]MDO6523934.1 type IV secretory system conjugative DNA transfer family protein [Shimia thalassica]